MGKTKTNKKERVKSQSSEEKSIIVDVTEKSDCLNSIQESPHDKSSLVKPIKVSNKKDSVEITTGSELVESAKLFAPKINQSEKIKPKSFGEEEVAIGLETIEKVDVTKPLKPKIKKKEHAKSQSSEEKSIIVDFTEKSDSISTVQELPQGKSSQAMPTKVSNKKDSFEIIS